MRARRTVVGVALGAVLALAGCHHRPTVERSRASDGDARHVLGDGAIVAPGTVEPWWGEVRLAGAEPGQIADIAVAEGQTVRKGDLVARLEDSAQRHALAIAEADVRQAAAMLDGMSSTPEELRAADADLEAAEARAARARHDGERAASLGASGALSAADVEAARSAARADEAARAAAEARLVMTRRGARTSERKLARARWESAEERQKEARAALARREVRSPIDGVVLWSRRHAGEFHSPAEGPLVVVGDVRRFQVRLEVDDADAPFIHLGAPCELRTDGGERLAGGTVVRVAAALGSRSLSIERPTARTDARVREIFVEVDGAAPIAPGQRAWGHIHRTELHASR
jgi:multidrug resistance efflux pump